MSRYMKWKYWHVYLEVTFCVCVRAVFHIFVSLTRQFFNNQHIQQC